MMAQNPSPASPPPTAQSTPVFTAPRNTLARAAMILGIGAFSFEHIILPFAANILSYLYTHDYNRINMVSASLPLFLQLTIINGVEVLLDLIAGVVVVILGFISLNRGRFLPPPVARRDQSLIGIVLGIVMLVEVASSILSFLPYLIFSVIQVK